MSLKNLWRSLVSFFTASEIDSLPRVHPPERFRTLIRNEMGRADRADGEFSLVVFTVRRRGGIRPLRLAEILTERTRKTDEIGRLGRRRLAVLLVNTGEPAARQFVRTIVDQAAGGGALEPPPFTVKIHPYPAVPTPLKRSPVTTIQKETDSVTLPGSR